MGLEDEAISLLDPAVKAVYQEVAKTANLRSAYTAAVTDYLKEPKIASVFTDNYKGEVGNVIFIAAVDQFKIQQMSITIMRADNTVIETGQPVVDQEQWRYVTTQPNSALAGSKIVIKAKDRPGKETTFEVVL